jgi:hypothetical protein
MECWGTLRHWEATIGNAKESLLALQWPLVFLGAEIPALFFLRRTKGGVSFGSNFAARTAS